MENCFLQESSFFEFGALISIEYTTLGLQSGNTGPRHSQPLPPTTALYSKLVNDFGSTCSTNWGNFLTERTKCLKNCAKNLFLGINLNKLLQILLKSVRFFEPCLHDLEAYISI